MLWIWITYELGTDTNIQCIVYGRHTHLASLCKALPSCFKNIMQFSSFQGLYVTDCCSMLCLLKRLAAGLVLGLRNKILVEMLKWSFTRMKWPHKSSNSFPTKKEKFGDEQMEGRPVTMWRWVKIVDAHVTKGMPATASDGRDWEKARKDLPKSLWKRKLIPAHTLGLDF